MVGSLPGRERDFGLVGWSNKVPAGGGVRSPHQRDTRQPHALDRPTAARNGRDGCRWRWSARDGRGAGPASAADAAAGDERGRRERSDGGAGRGVHLHRGSSSHGSSAHGVPKVMQIVPDAGGARRAINGRLVTIARMAAIPAERCIVGRDLTEPRLAPDGSCVVYGLAAGGRAALMWQPLDGSPVRQLSAHPAPRTGRGMGGGCWCWSADGRAIAYAAEDGELWWQPVPAGQVRRLTAHGPDHAAAAPAAVPGGGAVVYTLDEAQVWSVSLADGTCTRLDDGSADFCFDPCPVAGGGAVRWQAWNVPDMPWDGARAQQLDLATGALTDQHAAGALQQPRTLADGTCIEVRDDTGWLNVWVGGAPLVDEPYEHAGPSWGQGQRSYAVSPDGSRVAFARNELGFGRLCVVDVATRTVQDVARGVHGGLSWEVGRLVALRTGARTPTELVVYDTGSWQRTVLAVGPLSGWEGAGLAEPELRTALAADGTQLHARLYRADAPTDRLLCWVHGGPTDQWQVTFLPRLAYWRAQGWNVLVPDHRGSTGHGRRYQQAMNGAWGELDVADTVDLLDAAQRDGLGAPARTVAIGASAGGFTALGVAARAPQLIAAVVAASPVADLLDLAERSHRFERHSTVHLVGPLPAAADVYRTRSPVAAAARLAAVPVLLVHGDADPVVPVEQSRLLAERIAAAGGDVELHVYAGEGHGLRQPAHQLDEYARVGAFLARVTGGR